MAKYTTKEFKEMVFGVYCFFRDHDEYLRNNWSNTITREMPNSLGAMVQMGSISTSQMYEGMFYFLVCIKQVSTAEWTPQEMRDLAEGIIKECPSIDTKAGAAHVGTIMALNSFGMGYKSGKELDALMNISY